MSESSQPRRRPAARVVCVDPDGRVLLLRWREPVTGDVIDCVPGGGIEPHETPFDAARREFAEETGLAARVYDASVDVPRDFTWNAARYCGAEQWFLGETDERAPAPRPTEFTEEEARDYRGHWWATTDEIAALAGSPTFVEPQAVLDMVAPRRFADGNVGGATRVGPTIRRPQGPWSGSVHAVLDHLRRKGMPGVPHVLGSDREGREVLSYLPGRSIDVDREVAADAQLAGAARWLARMHAEMADFRIEDPQWRCLPSSPGESVLICHLDAGAYNWVVDGDRFTGLVDWDLAGPGTPLDELAYIAWNSVPLFGEFEPREAARRIRLLADQYRDEAIAIGSSFAALAPTPSDVAVEVPARLASVAARVGRGQRAGDPGMLNLMKVGEPARMLAGRDLLMPRVPAIVSALS